MIYLQIFIWYYPISTGIVLYWYFTHKDQIEKENPIFSIIPESVILLSIIFTGWLACPLILNTFYLDWRIKRLSKQISKLDSELLKVKIPIGLKEYLNSYNKKVENNLKKTRTPEIEK